MSTVNIDVKTNYCYQPLAVANTQETAVKVIAWIDFIEYTCNPGSTHAVRLRLSDSLRLERFALWKPFLKFWDFGVPAFWPDTQGRRKIDNWGGGAHIHIFVFCPINFIGN